MPDHLNQAVAGLDLDSTSHQIKEGWLTYAYNAMIEGFDGNSVTYQNEQGNEMYVQFPAGYKLIGSKNITELKQVYYFLTNPSNGNSEIGWTDYGFSVYNTLISDAASLSGKFNFSREFPIHKIITKTTNCTTQLYWTEGLHNTLRWLDLSNLPWVEKRNPANDYHPIKDIGQLDPNMLRVQPNFNIPEITPEEVTIGGNLQMGVYQFAIQYSNALGEGYTSYFSVTNPISIWQDVVTNDFNLTTSKAIHLLITGLDTTGIYDNFNLAVVKTVNQISSAYLIGTFPIATDKFEYTYSGVDSSPIQLTIEEVLIKYPHYDMANDIYEVDHSLGWADLYADDEVNYQEVWSQVKLEWETYQLPYDQFEGYLNGVNSALYRGYMRDEVQAFEGYFFLKSGRQTKSFHIPGRIATPYDMEGVGGPDTAGATDPCADVPPIHRWQIYNTASVTHTTTGVEGDICYIGPYQSGPMAYWESELRYPISNVWGALGGQKIRHHKFPDNGISPHFSNNPSNSRSFVYHIYPMGVRIDAASLQAAIKHSSLTQAQQDDIVGFGIARGNRAGGNASIVAKGIFNNVGKYTFEEKEYYYPNYPYNDLRPDAFFAKQKLQHHAGYVPSLSLDGFGEWSHSRFVFHSPDTHFTQPPLGDIMKVEGLLYGKSYSHFVKVQDNAEYKLMTREAYEVAAAVAVASGLTLGSGTFGTPSYTLSGVAGVYQSMLEIMEKIMPWNNFGYSFNSIGFYNNFVPVPDSGNKVRHILSAKYIVDGFQGIEPGNTINNLRRESAVYIHTTGNFPFPHEYPGIPVDNSRFTITSYMGGQATADDFYALFVSTNTANITNEFISGMMGVLSIASPPLYHFKLTYSYTGGGATPPYADMGPTVGTIYSDAYGNVYRTTAVTAGFPQAVSGHWEILYEWWAEVLVVGSQPPPIATSGVLTLHPSNPTTDYPPASVTYSTVLAGTYLDYYSTDAVTTATYIYDIRQIFYIYAGDRSAIDAPDDPSVPPKIGWLIKQARGTYYAAYSDYLANLPKVAALKERDADISCYYGSIKRTLPDQWGQMYSYQSISTGYYQEYKDSNGALINTYATVFGGDTFINQFTYKSKVPFFISNTVGKPNGADVNYDELGNYGYPAYWLSTKPIEGSFNIAKEAERAAQVVLHPGAVDYLVNIIQGGGHTAHAGGDVIEKLFQGIIQVLGIKNTNLDNFAKKNMYEEGIMYLFAYGLPTFFVESAINVEHRQAINETWGNFYPHVGNEIPDNWFQEVVTPIIHDNNYTYNFTYSKQNKEVLYTHLREDYDPNMKCLTQFPNRTFWSDRSQMEETRNNWLIYRPASYYDLPKSNGKLTAIDSLENDSILVRFENKSQIYNAMITVDTSAHTAFIGNNSLFAGVKPIDLTHTDGGSGGSQNKFLLRTDEGVVYIDALRGQVILLKGNQATNIADRKASRFLSNNLPFVISEHIPGIPTDNHFNGIGLTGVYDSSNARLIFTKLDYEPLVPMIYFAGKLYLAGALADALPPPATVAPDVPVVGQYILPGVDGPIVVEEEEGEVPIVGSGVLVGVIGQHIPSGFPVVLGDPKYFKDRSWTLSYCFSTQSWVSFHGYKPNFYIPYPTTFHSGLNALENVWEHASSFTLFNSFYGILSPYVLEYPFIYKSEDELIASVQDYCSARIYTNEEIYNEPDEILYFNKAILYNDAQCTGTLRLIPRDDSDLSFAFQYPKYNAADKEIIVSRSDSFFQFNDFWNIVKTSSQPTFTQCRIDDKCLNAANLDYALQGHQTGAIRGKDCRVRLILDDKDDIKLISRFTILNTQTSYK